MRQSIEQKHKTKLTRAFTTVMFCGRVVILDRANAFCAQMFPDPSLVFSMGSETGSFDAFEAKLLLSSRGIDAFARVRRFRTRHQSIAHKAELSAEAPMVRSACLVSGANLNSRGPAVAFITTTTMTEQRRCEAA